MENTIPKTSAEKKSMLSFFTSMAGAILNVILNLILIPTMGAKDPTLGAMGAASATTASYMLCFGLRVWSAKKIKPFNMHMGRQIVSTILVLAQVAVINIGFKGWIIVEGVLLLAVMLLNCKPLIDILKLLLGDRLSARKQKKS